MIAISLFTGAMGLDLGIEKAGFHIRVCNEIDPIFAETIRLNTKTPVICKDINNVSAEDLLTTGGIKMEEVDLIFGGPPCQAFSTAGARRGLGDARGNAILSFLRLVRDIKPKTFLLENVRGLLYAKIDFVPEGFNEEKYQHILGKKGALLYFLYKEFGNLGYKVSFSLFDSANYGVPQKRERVLMFGTRLKHEILLPKPTHSKDGAIGKKWVSIQDAFTGLEEKDMEYVEFRDKHKHYLKKLKAGEYWKHLSAEDQEAALGGAYKLQGGKTGFFRRLSWEKPSPTLVTSPIMPATMLCHPDKLRPLSLQEYARIQQFPEDWIFAGNIAQKYKQIGNAVPVGLGYAAGKSLMSYLAGLQDGKNERGKSHVPGRSKVACDLLLPEMSVFPDNPGTCHHQKGTQRSQGRTEKEIHKTTRMKDPIICLSAQEPIYITCSNCGHLNKYTPPLPKKYGEKLEVKTYRKVKKRS